MSWIGNRFGKAGKEEDERLAHRETSSSPPEWIRAPAPWRSLRSFSPSCSPAASSARAQSTPTASRAGDLQFGGGFTFGNSDYNFNKVTLTGGAFYATFDKRDHWGYEADFRQVRPSSDATVYERTYEVGPRFYFTRGRFAPYAKVLYGRGVYNFSNNVANIAYNLYTFGGGADFVLTPLNLRADYEYQNWLDSPSPPCTPASSPSASHTTSASSQVAR